MTLLLPSTRLLLAVFAFWMTESSALQILGEQAASMQAKAIPEWYKHSYKTDKQIEKEAVQELKAMKKRDAAALKELKDEERAEKKRENEEKKALKRGEKIDQHLHAKKSKAGKEVKDEIEIDEEQDNFEFKELWEEDGGHHLCPSLFVAIISGQQNVGRRDMIRDMWNQAHHGYDNKFGAKFALCTAGGIPPEIQEEQDKYGDMWFMDCEEGYLDGILTRKVATSMRLYMEHHSSFRLFMKIDDDTWISSKRLCEFMNVQMQNGVDMNAVYMGVFAEGDEKPMQKHPPIRDPTSQWYEPYDKFPEHWYPVSAKGGPGYILSRNMVERIIEDGIADTHELNNEDKAVGYWVELLPDTIKDRMSYVNLNGTDGYEEHARFIVTSGPFEEYPYVVHHHLSAGTIKCLNNIEKSVGKGRVEYCFTGQLKSQRGHPSIFPWAAETEQRIHMPY